MPTNPSDPTQRNEEKYIQDSVTPIPSVKQTATVVALIAAVLVLIPMAPELADSVGVGTDPGSFIM